MYRLYIYLVCVLVIVACNDNNPYENELGVDPALMAQIDTANHTTIKWLDSVVNVGAIRSGDSVCIKYNFQNTGSTALFIVEARSSCGCTVAVFPKHPVMPGKISFITATLKTGALSGDINRSVTVVTNTKNKANHILLIKARVQ